MIIAGRMLPEKFIRYGELGEDSTIQLLSLESRIEEEIC
jgi:hypothetical protein